MRKTNKYRIREFVGSGIDRLQLCIGTDKIPGMRKAVETYNKKEGTDVSLVRASGGKYYLIHLD